MKLEQKAAKNAKTDGDGLGSLPPWRASRASVEIVGGKSEQKVAKNAKSDGDGLGSLPPSRPWRASVLILLSLFPLGVQAGSGSWFGLWLTPDQQGKRYFHRGEFAEAAQAFRDPMWQGAAWYRAGEFEKAAQAFARRDTAEAHFNQGNAWLMRGRYETAIASYDRAVEKRPDRQESADNRPLGMARAKLVEQKGGDMGDQKIGADKVVFDKDAKNEGQETEVAGAKALSDQEVQALWLRRVQTRPADFLKAKFAYQEAMQQEGAK